MTMANEISEKSFISLLTFIYPPYRFTILMSRCHLIKYIV